MKKKKKNTCSRGDKINKPAKPVREVFIKRNRSRSPIERKTSYHFKEGCPLFVQGNCEKGDSCSFHHTSSLHVHRDGQHLIVYQDDRKDGTARVNAMMIMDQLKFLGCEQFDDFNVAKKSCFDVAGKMGLNDFAALDAADTMCCEKIIFKVDLPGDTF